MKISIQTLGELTVYHNSQRVDLPPSKRTRALLAYLAIQSRPQRRDRLCEVFWESPNDPRGALRWSLSKIRPLVNDTKYQRLVADRERVTLVTHDIKIDINSIAYQLADSNTSLKELIDLSKALKEPLLDGIDLPEQALFQQWLNNERLEIERLRGRLFTQLSCHPDLPIPERLQWTRQWQTIEPYNPDAATQLLTQLELLGLNQEVVSLRPKLIKRFQRAEIAWLPEYRKLMVPDNGPEIPIAGRELLARQKIQFCTAKDGARIAYVELGKGLPIVKAANWLSHLEYDWDAPIWSPLFRELAVDHHFIRYDERGNGLSDWDVSDISFESFVSDLETVVDACDVEKFALLGISQGAAVSIEYAIRHPERVSQLILFGGYAKGWRIDATEASIKEREAIMTLTETGWGQDNPAYRQIFSSTFMPSASASELAWFNEFQRLTTSPENAVRFLSVFGDIDVSKQLAKVAIPTLVIHSLGDLRIPVEIGRDIAATIPNAEFVGLDSDGHLLRGCEPASSVFIATIKDFISRTQKR